MTHTPPLPKLPEPTNSGSKGFAPLWAPLFTEEQMRAYALEALSQRGEAVAWLHKCRKRPDLKQLSFLKRRPDLAAKGYKPQPLFTAPQPAQPDVLSLLLSDEVLEAATLAHEQSSCHDLIGPMSDALKAAAERVRAMVPARPAKPVPKGYVLASETMDVQTLHATLVDLVAEAGAVDTVIGRPEVLRSRLAALRDELGRVENGRVRLTPAKPVPMTDGQIKALANECYDGGHTDPLVLFARGVESFHHIKEQP